MKSKYETVISLAKKIAILLVISSICGIPFVTNMGYYIKGILLGGIFTVLKLFLMEGTFSKAVQKTPGAAIAYARLHYMFRYILTLLIIAIAILEPTIHPVGVIIGLLSMKLAAYWQGMEMKPTPKDGSVEFVEWVDDEDETKDF